MDVPLIPGFSCVVARTELLRAVVTVVSSHRIDTVCYHQPANDVVLDMTLGNGNGAIRYFDPMFWTLTLDGRAVTSGDVEDLERTGLRGVAIAIAIDPENRRLDLRPLRR